ncbi:MAG: response regulator [Terriglobia bacterium]
MDKVLLVEDNVMNMELARDILQAEGYTVAVATSGIEALERVKFDRPDLIIMDIQLPNMDGLTATRILKNDPATRDIPVVALTAHAMKGDEGKILEAGCSDYLPKPLNVKDFLAVVGKRLKVESPA